MPNKNLLKNRKKGRVIDAKIDGQENSSNWLTCLVIGLLVIVVVLIII